MPNHVTNKILFQSKYADVVFGVFNGGNFDFEILVPQPPNLYQGNLGSDDENDFPLNWRSWNRENWGTKWNCYSTSSGVDGDLAYLKFDTAWAPPYPVIAAFCNKFNIPFEHRYFDEGSNFWGVEKWDIPEVMGGDKISRVSKRKSAKSDYAALCIELKGYDPENQDEE